MRPYYSDDRVTIYHGDALDVVPTLAKVDLVLADPPYIMPAQHYSSRTRWQRSWGDTAIMGRWWDGAVAVLSERLRGSGHLLSFCDDESYAVFFPALYGRFARVASLVWRKPMGMGTPWRRSHELVIAGWNEGAKWNGGGGTEDVIDAPSVPSSDRAHPVDKPTDLLSQLILPTTDEGDTVLDPFAGGGSTLVAAKNLGRKAIGIEIEERYCEGAATRLSQEILDLGGAA